MENTVKAQVYPPISANDGGLNGYHNYFVEEEFFSRNNRDGTIHIRDGQRAAKVSEDFVVGLHSGLDEDIGDASGLVMYKCGREWGLNDMKRFNNRMRHEYGGGKLDIWQMNPKFVFESWWWPLTIQGWGSWTLDMSFRKRGVTFVEIRNSAVARSMRRVGKPVCHLYAGMFAGVLSYWDKKDRDSIEVQCYSMGNDVCKFMIGEEKQVNAAEFWHQEGATAEEIRGKFE
ncbi:MAG: V4R domain-containing protein [Verrucomicrobiota bacterium]